MVIRCALLSRFSLTNMKSNDKKQKKLLKSIRLLFRRKTFSHFLHNSLRKHLSWQWTRNGLYRWLYAFFLPITCNLSGQCFDFYNVKDALHRLSSKLCRDHLWLIWANSATELGSFAAKEEIKSNTISYPPELVHSASFHCNCHPVDDNNCFCTIFL